MSSSLNYLLNLSRSVRLRVMSRLTGRNMLIITSTAGVITLCAVAVYFRRKRKPGSFPSPILTRKNNYQQRNVDQTPNRTSHQHSRDHSSMSCSSVRSTASSAPSRRQLLKSMDQEAKQKAQDLYAQGASEMKHALEQWQQASLIINSSSSVNSSPQSQRRRRRHKKSENHRSLSRSSFVSHDSINEAGDAPLEMASIQDDVSEIMEQVGILSTSFCETFAESSSDTDMTITDWNERNNYLDSDSGESFVSANEVWDIMSNEMELKIYEEGLVEVRQGRVNCRTYRTELLQCYSDSEFLAKLYCIRKSFDVLLKDTYVRNWLINSGRRLIEGILKVSNRSLDAFNLSFSQMIDFVSSQDNWPMIEDELYGRKVTQMSFYDIVLDFIIMDSFDDLEDPPSSVVSVLNNRWLSDSLKQTALSAAVWSVLKAKSQLLRQRDGFISHFYEISRNISPVLAWGFLGTDEVLKETCVKFKSEVISFLQELFNFEVVRYTNASEMADDILKLTKGKIHNMFTHFDKLHLQSSASNNVLPTV